MKLRELTRKRPKDIKRTLKLDKTTKRDVPNKEPIPYGDGTGDNAVRGLNNNQGEI